MPGSPHLLDEYGDRRARLPNEAGLKRSIRARRLAIGEKLEEGEFRYTRKPETGNNRLAILVEKHFGAYPLESASA